MKFPHGLEAMLGFPRHGHGASKSSRSTAHGGGGKGQKPQDRVFASRTPFEGLNSDTTCGLGVPPAECEREMGLSQSLPHSS